MVSCFYLLYILLSRCFNINCAWELEYGYGYGVGGLGELACGMVDKHRWFSGRIIAFQAVDPGSIPGRCIFTFVISDIDILFY